MLSDDEDADDADDGVAHPPRGPPGPPPIVHVPQTLYRPPKRYAVEPVEGVQEPSMAPCTFLPTCTCQDCLDAGIGGHDEDGDAGRPSLAPCTFLPTCTCQDCLEDKLDGLNGWA
jgi:hypothetical protein